MPSSHRSADAITLDLQVLAREIDRRELAAALAAQKIKTAKAYLCAQRPDLLVVAGHLDRADRLLRRAS